VTDLEIAVEAARAAGAVLRAHPSPHATHHKGAVDLVTEVDLACERAIREVLGRRTPNVPVLGEEGGGAETATTRWVVDPLDGTTNFVHGFPFYAVSVALERDGEIVAGCLYEPLYDRLYTAARGQGAFRDGQPIRVTDRRTLREALVATGFGYDRHERPDHYLRPFRAVMVRSQGMRRAGAACLDLAMVADGRLDAYYELEVKRWDVAAGLLLVQEAGGRVSPAPGWSLDGVAGLGIVATNPHVHDELLEVLAGA